MAIDDNASYELTGAQVKDLADKIKAKAADNIFVGATSAAPGSKGLVPQPQAGDDTKYLKGDGTWATIDDNHAELYLNGTLWDSADISGWNGHIYTDASFTNMLTVSEFESLFMDSNPTDVWIWLPPHGDSTQAVLRLITKEVSDPNYPAYAATFIWSDTNGRQVIYTFYPDENGDGTTDFSVDRYELQQLLTAGSNITINDTTISATDTTYSDFGGATAQQAGAAGLVPAPAAGDQEKVLLGNGTWGNATAKLVEMSYGESNAWAKFIAAYNAGSIVYCRASSNSDPATGAQGRKAFMAYVNNATTPTEVEFQYVRSVNSKSASQQSDQVFVYKLTNANGGTWTAESRNMAPKIIAGTGMGSTFTNGANATITLSAATMTGATSSRAGAAGIVPAPAAGDGTKFLAGDGTWKTASGGGGGTAVHKLAVDSGDYVWDPIICPVACAVRNIYVYDPDAQGPLDVLQLVQWALNGDDFVITGAQGMGYYGKVAPIKARVDVAVGYDFDPTNPQLSHIDTLQISFHVADCSRANLTYPRVPFEYDAVLCCTSLDQSELEWRATVYQGNTLPLFYEPQLEEGASFTWESLANARVVQGVNTPSADIQRALSSEDSFYVTDSEILRRILSALFTGKTISVKALANSNDYYFASAGVEFDRFLFESTEGYYDFSDVNGAFEAIQNERVKLHLYASSSGQGLEVQFFGSNVTVSGS